MTDLASLDVNLRAETAQYTAAFKQATQTLQDFSKAVDGFAGQIGERLVELFTVGALIEWGREILNGADHLQKFAQQVGTSVEDLSRLQFALTASGVPAEDLANIYKTLNDNLSTAAGDGTTKAAIAFGLLKVNVNDASGRVRDANSVLADVASRFAGMADGANKTALAVALFGKRGAELIPFLNLGADGIQKLKDKSDALGATLDGPTARAAEAFKDRLNELQTAFVQGIGNTILRDFLPVLDDLAASFGKASEQGKAFGHVTEVIETGLKFILDAGLTVAKTFDDFGTTLGAIGAQAAALVHGRLSEVAAIQKQLHDDIEASDKSFQDRINAIWAAGDANVLAEVKITAQKMKDVVEAPNLAAAEAAAKAVDALKKVADQLGLQVATFDLGEAAIVRYRLTVGDLAKEVKTAGASGDKLVASIIAQANALQRLKDTKEITQGLDAINAEIAKLSGIDSPAAAIGEFQKKNASLIAAIVRQGDAAAESQIEHLQTLVGLTAKYNGALADQQRIEGAIGDAQSLLDNAIVTGQVTELQGLEATGKLRQAEADQLQVIYEKQLAIAQATGNPDQIAAVARLGTQITILRSQTDLAAQSIKKGFEDDLAGPLLDLETHVKSLGDAFGALVDNIEKQLLQLANQQIIKSLFASLSGLGGGAGGGIFGAIAGAFTGSGKAAGGPVVPGIAYPVNENKNDPEYFIPSTSGRIVPSSQMSRGATVHQTFVIQAPQGTVSRSTQMQLGAQAMKGLDLAQRRNG